MESNTRPLRIWADAKILGWDVALALHNLRLTEWEADELLYRLRVIALEVATLKRKGQDHEPGAVP